jgi:hypothetical protein
MLQASCTPVRLFLLLLAMDLRMYLPLYVEPRDVHEAEILMATYGKAAGLEAAERAEAFRNVGNHINFCRWRQIERLVIMLSVEATLGTIH